MRYRTLGTSDLEVSEIGLGCLEFGDRVPESDAARLVHASLDAGVNLFDTADRYARGRSEEALGKALQGRRHEAIVATKVGLPASPGPRRSGLTRRFVTQAVDESLRRLRTDYIDLYQVHVPDYDTPIEETVGAFEELQKAGKIRYYGHSNTPAWYLCDAQWRARQSGFSGFVSTQVKYNVIGRDAEQELFPLCRQEGIGIIAYNPLAGSFLTGMYRQDREPDADTRFGWSGLTDLKSVYTARYWSERNFQAVEALRSLWGGTQRTLAQHALAWVLGNPLVSSALVGVASVEELAEDLAAAEIVHSASEREACDRVWASVWPVRPYYTVP